MPVDTYTTFMREPEPKDREQSIEAYLKARVQSFDKAVAGYTNVSLLGLSGNVDLTPTQAKHRIIRLTDAPAGAVTVRIPHATGANADPVVVNDCTGGSSTVTLKSTGGNVGNPSGVSIGTGQARHVRHDGDSVYLPGLPLSSTGFVPTSAGGTGGDVGAAWVSYTPALTPGSGTFTSASATGRYRIIGKNVYFRIRVAITTNGTAAVSITAGLPAQASWTDDQTCAGMESVNTGKSLRCFIAAGGFAVQARFYDGTYPGGNGNVLLIQGVYESA